MANYKSLEEYDRLISLSEYEKDMAIEEERPHKMLDDKIKKLKDTRKRAEEFNNKKQKEENLMDKIKQTKEQQEEMMEIIKKKILNFTLFEETGFKYFYSIDKQKLQRMYIKTGICTDITNIKMMRLLEEEFGINSKISKNLLNYFPELHLDFNPHKEQIYLNEQTGLNNYNTFIKPKILKENEFIKLEIDEGEIELKDFDWSKFKYIDMLFRNLFYKDDKMREHWMNWFAYILQTLDKTLMTFVFTGAQGAGKGILFKYIIQYVFGKYAIEIDSKSIHSNFNSLMENKLFVWGNEIKQTDKNKRDGDYNVLKTIITDKDLRIEKKGVDSKIVENFFNTSFSSNESNPLQVEVTDRRYNFVETFSDIKKVYEKEGIGIDEIIDGIVEERERFIKDLLRIKTDKKKANNALMNNKKRKVINATESLSNNIVKILKDKDWELLEDFVYDNNEENYENSAFIQSIKNSAECNYITNKDLLKLYKMCSTIGDKITDNAIARMFNNDFYNSEKKRVYIKNKKETIRIINKYEEVDLEREFEFDIDKETGLVIGNK